MSTVVSVILNNKIHTLSICESVEEAEQKFKEYIKSYIGGCDPSSIEEGIDEGFFHSDNEELTVCITQP